MKKFEVIECVIKDNIELCYDEVFYKLIFKVDDCEFKYNMLTSEKDRLTKEEFILKVKKEIENL